MRLQKLALAALLTAVLFTGACKSTEQVQTQPAQAATAPQTPAETTAESLIDKNIAARGGLDAMNGLQALKMTGEVQMMGMVLPITVYSQRPRSQRSEVEVAQMGATFVNAFDGETAWAINPMMSSAPQKMSGDILRITRANSYFDGALIEARQQGYEVEYQGEDEVRGNPAHKLLVKRGEFGDITVYLDAETGLEVKTEAEGINPQSGSVIPQATYYLDYRDLNGVPTAHRLEIETGGQVSQVLTIGEVEVNPEIDPSIFTFPGQ